MYVALITDEEAFIKIAKIRRSAIAEVRETAQLLTKTAYTLAESTSGRKCDDLFPSTYVVEISGCPIAMP